MGDSPRAAELRTELAALRDIDAKQQAANARARLRDEFAMAAITGTLPGAAVGDERVKEYAQWAYKMADAMLEVRNANR